MTDVPLHTFHCYYRLDFFNLTTYISFRVYALTKQVARKRIRYKPGSLALDQHQLTINEKKCMINVLQVTFLRRNIDDKTRTTQEAVDKIMQMKMPTNIHELRVFFGLTGHFQHFIPNYSGITRPLNNLKKKDIVFEMSGDPEEAFHKLVKFISTNPILSFPDWSLPFELCTDASHKGTGGIFLPTRPVTSTEKAIESNWFLLSFFHSC